MRKVALCIQVMGLCLFLAACGGKGAGESDQLALEIRGRYIEMQSCHAVVEVTADYGERVYAYTIDMTCEKEGETVLTVTAPEEIAGVTARIAAGGTRLEYDGVMVETGAVDARGLSPIDALPALLDYAKQGYITGCALETLEEDGAEVLHVTYGKPDAEPGTGVEAALWFDAQTCALIQGEITLDGFVVLRCDYLEFILM